MQVPPEHPESGDERFEELLRRGRATPSPAWMHQTERALLPARSDHGARRRLTVIAAATGGLAAVVVAISLAGGGPLAADGGDDARAKPGCETVYVTRVEQAGELVRSADGSVRVETTDRPVTREEQRCR